MFNALAWLIAQFYGLTKSYGVSIILLTITVRLILFPLTARQTRSMQNMQKVQPQVKQLQAQYKDDRQKLNEELMKFYKQNKINPAAGCLPLLLQMPIFFALYRVIYGLTSTRELSGLMIRVPHPKYLSQNSDLSKSLVNSGGRMVSWGVDLAQSASAFTGPTSKKLPYIVLVVLIAVTGYLQATLMARKQPAAATGQAAQMQKIMKVMPLFFALISFNIQAAVVIYWIAGNIWTIGQQEVLSRFFPSTPAVLEAQATEVPAVVATASKATAGKANGPAKTASPPSTVKPVKPVNPVRPAAKKTTAAPASGAASNTRKKK